MTTRGKHILVEFWGCRPENLRDEKQLINTLILAAQATGATIIGKLSQTFPGEGGVSAILMLSESHLSIHTYPEVGYSSMDCYTCGESCEPMLTVPIVQEGLGATRCYILELERGLGGQPRLRL